MTKIVIRTDDVGTSSRVRRMPRGEPIEAKWKIILPAAFIHPYAGLETTRRSPPTPAPSKTAATSPVRS